ncbi:MAG: bifunctional diaminohydroxyphosphoribosylaminopyrimidine deaminase/5-amino-6-(5-phosphoribosylamino)uracil reductase RibD [Pseudomonadota bacterium]
MTPDQLHMRRALELARLQAGRTGKNPSVGCVLVDHDGVRIAEAATGDGGHIHAEELALSRLPYGRAVGASAYVTLEPCRERSTDKPSCSQRLIEAGVTRVVIGALDPHPQGRGGLVNLREAGVQVETGLMAEAADALYADFFASVARLGD